MSKKKKKSKKNKEAIKIKKMPGEFIQQVINIGIDCRSGLQHYYAIGGNQAAFGLFKGQVIQIEKNKGYLFKRLSIEFKDQGYYWDNDCAYSEDHVWIFDAQPFKDAGIKVGDSVQFTALVYAYHRKDGSEDYSLKCPQDIEKIDDYELPKEPEGISESFLEDLVCETCLYTDHCYRLYCIGPEGYKENMIDMLKKSLENNNSEEERRIAENSIIELLNFINNQKNVHPLSLEEFNVLIKSIANESKKGIYPFSTVNFEKGMDSLDEMGVLYDDKHLLSTEDSYTLYPIIFGFFHNKFGIFDFTTFTDLCEKAKSDIEFVAMISTNKKAEQKALIRVRSKKNDGFCITIQNGLIDGALI